ncbi:hypothetical protein SAMN05421740_103384 [Parapedobacter koreensis]|uniref:Uncharacterized protein n=1 Tax=Parapedobacter koreensis TaxID=332977 RepID=A0A1H7M671_9SPHI|nr:hypothetical protein SAMN05421740_103384 [Parapedobacter koreensis]
MQPLRILFFIIKFVVTDVFFTPRNFLLVGEVVDHAYHENRSGDNEKDVFINISLQQQNTWKSAEKTRKWIDWLILSVGELAVRVKSGLCSSPKDKEYD